MRPPLLEVRDLSLRFGGVTALDSVGFCVDAGETMAVIGPNGAGKTSMLNCLNQVYRPGGGSIRLDGVELVGRRPSETARLGVGRTFQNVALFPGLDLVDNLLLGRHHLMSGGFLAGALRLRRARREDELHRAACEEIVETLGLGQHRGRPVGALPFGVRKLVELARALAMEPRLLLLDEPAAGANFDEMGAMAQAIDRARTSAGLTVLLVEHDMGMVTRLADRVTVLDFGRVIACGPPSEVLRHPAVVAAYLGAAPGPAAR